VQDSESRRPALAATAVQPLPGESERLPVPVSSRRRPAGPPISRVDAANRAAVREPSRESYVNAVQVYSWSEGALYRLYTTPERVSEIALQPGETLISVAAGDTARWVIGDTKSVGAGRRTHILVKPSAVGNPRRRSSIHQHDSDVVIADQPGHRDAPSAGRVPSRRERRSMERPPR
jgi:type IV secretion system protein TrbG